MPGFRDRMMHLRRWSTRHHQTKANPGPNPAPADPRQQSERQKRPQTHHEIPEQSHENINEATESVQRRHRPITEIETRFQSLLTSLEQTKTEWEARIQTRARREKAMREFRRMYAEKLNVRLCNQQHQECN